MQLKTHGSEKRLHPTVFFLLNSISLDLTKFYTISVVRNPYDRLVSIFHWIKKNDIDKIIHAETTFETFCHDFDNNNKLNVFKGTQTQQLTDNGKNSGKIIVDKILRFETLQRDLNSLNLHAQYPFNLKRTNRTKHEHYSHYYNSETKALIESYYNEDFKRFNYIFDTKKK